VQTRTPRFGFLAPFRDQAKSIAWDYLMHYASPITRKTSTLHSGDPQRPTPILRLFAKLDRGNGLQERRSRGGP
jgi:hypothetical protein